MRLSVVAIMTSIAVALSGAAIADPPSPGSTTVSGVVVTATPAEKKKVESFVKQVTALSPGVQMARWDRSVCTGVLGLPDQHAQFMNDRIAANAVAVGLETGKPGCKANVLILVTPDAEAFTRDIVKTHPRVFNPYDAGHTRGPKALKAFVETQAPVRWWHLTQTKGYGGFEVSESNLSASGSHGMDRPTVEVWGKSPLHSGVVEVFGGILIVVDAKRAQGVSYQALCDYISMVALAQINPDVDSPSLPSILTLFRDRDDGKPLPTGLTAWDLGYLKALYDVPADVERATRERDSIAEKMKKETPEPPPASSPAPKPQ